MSTETDIEELAEELAGPDRPGETYLEAVGRLTNARLTARELIMADKPPPVPEQPEETPATEAEWVPVVEDPAHPFWRRLREQE